MKRKYETFKKYPGVRAYISDRRKLPDGKPDKCFYIRYKTHTGRLIEEKIGWASEGISAAYAAQIRAERLRSIRLDEEVIPIQQRRKLQWTFSEFIERRYLPWAEQEKALKTYKREREIYKIWLKPILGDKLLKEICPLDLERLKKKMKEAGRAERTIEIALATVRRAFNKAKDWELFEGENPVSKVKIPRRDNRRLRFLSPEEAEALLAEVRKRSQQTYEMCLLALHCGLRFGEITSLTWGDIDLTQGIIFIRDPKNKTSRVAYMTNEVQKMFAGKIPGAPEEYVFKDRRHGGKIKWLSKAFGESVKTLKLNEGVQDPRMKVCFHTLRHTFGSWLVMAGVPIYTVKELMGHKTLAMTERYAHLAAEAQRQAIKEIEKVARQATSSKVVSLTGRQGG
ncbi:integrase family protein [Thermodesulfatator indicus DSM 15286]|uniref:Integrase family protein n=1 Tax=Thermodesulfatator indicus (strain DSM 15286 / JCM 11887 / CIR29812) TaxID=667014 RepID=F8AAD9_THEID|nr:site-specific integrase [Thermodesulfatator indicus]AEH45359.1 integrase family protein [Thermodesulfatator indicus DSM 15286]